MAFNIAELKSIYTGIGLGQTKGIGSEYVEPWGLLSVPSSIGAIMAEFGLVGVMIKLIAPIFLFYKTKTFENYYRFCLFFLIFIYQFTGSYLINIVEYTIWVMAFCINIFPEFNIKKIQHQSRK